MGKFKINIRQMSSDSVLIEWPQFISEEILDDIIVFKEKMLLQHGGFIKNHTPAYTSLLIQYKENIDYESLKEELVELYNAELFIKKIENKTWHIPVCYDRTLGRDIQNFITAGIDHRKLVALHTSAKYRVYMIGFLPGFLYLGGLNEELYMPRKKTPSLKTPKGAVAIGGQQTGIYPMESPGGWHVIGRTPVDLFNLDTDSPTPINQGDFVQFYEVDLKTYEVLAN